MGIYIADMVAGGQGLPMMSRTIRATEFTVSLRELYADMQRQNSFGIADAEGTLNVDLVHALSKHTLKRYIENRERVRHKNRPDLPLRWTHVNVHITGKFLKQERNKKAQIARVRLAWDKVYTGENLSKGGKQDNICELCGETPDNLVHLMCRCSKAEMVHERQLLRRDIHAFIKEQCAKDKSVAPRQFLEFMLGIAYESDEDLRTEIWTGATI